MRSFLLFLVLCAVAAAFVSRERRAVNSEELPQTSTTTGKPIKICAPDTPCGWATYITVAKIIEHEINNTYCICSTDTVCEISEENTEMKVFIYKCRLPVDLEEEADAES